MATVVSNKIDTDWFRVDKKGLAQLLERRGKEWAVLELLQNALDTPAATRVDIVLGAAETRGYSTLTVTDNDPDGFHDMTHSYTLFAPSIRKADPTKRGRFNMGEKTVLALCSEATIVSTTGGVAFGEDGRTAMSERRAAGTQFVGLVKMTKAEREDAITALHQVIVPEGVVLTVNGLVVEQRSPIEVIEGVTLETEREDEDGNLKRTRRQTTLSLYEPPAGVAARIYELGIPVVETGDRWDVSVGQKVPLNMERDGVTPAYLRSIRVAVANAMADKLTGEDAATTWANEALESPDISSEAAQALVTARYGDRAFIHNPSDPEATRIAVGQGFTPVYGKAFSKAAWENVRSMTDLRAAPASPRVQLSGQGPSITIPEEKWTVGMHRIHRYTEYLGEKLLGFTPSIRFVSSADFNAAAAWGDREITFNKLRLGNAWFDTPNQEGVDGLLIHEFGHHFGDHLDPKYHDALVDLGAKAITLARAGQLGTV